MGGSEITRNKILSLLDAVGPCAHPCDFSCCFRLSLIGLEVARTFVTTLTTWELEELRSVNEFMKEGYQMVLQGEHGSDFRLRGIPAQPDLDIRDVTDKTRITTPWLLESRYISLFEPQSQSTASIEANKFEYPISLFIEDRQDKLDEPIPAKLSTSTKAWADSPQNSVYRPGSSPSINPHIENIYLKTRYRGRKVNRKIYHN